MTKLLKINLKKQVKLTEYFLTNLRKKTMIILVTQHLKMVVAKGVLVGLEVSVVQTFQIFLKISLEILVVVEEEVLEVEVPIIEDQI